MDCRSDVPSLRKLCWDAIGVGDVACSLFHLFRLVSDFRKFNQSSQGLTWSLGLHCRDFPAVILETGPCAENTKGKASKAAERLSEARE